MNPMETNFHPTNTPYFTGLIDPTIFELHQSNLEDGVSAPLQIGTKEKVEANGIEIIPLNNIVLQIHDIAHNKDNAPLTYPDLQDHQFLGYKTQGMKKKYTLIYNQTQLNQALNIAHISWVILKMPHHMQTEALQETSPWTSQNPTPQVSPNLIPDNNKENFDHSHALFELEEACWMDVEK